MKPTLKLGLNIQFCGQEAELVQQFKEKNPVIKHVERAEEIKCGRGRRVFILRPDAVKK